MNFKKEYEQAFSGIKAEDAFKKQLINNLEREVAGGHHGKTILYQKLLVLAAVLLLMLGIGYWTDILFDRGSEKELTDELLTQEEDMVEMETEDGMLAETDAGEGYEALEIPSGERTEETQPRGLRKLFEDFREKVQEFLE